MKQYSLSAIDNYMNRVFKILIVFVPVVAISAGTIFTVIKLLGYYTDVPLPLLLTFDASCVLYFIVGLIFKFRCEDSTGTLKPRIVTAGKIYIAVLIFIQWNFISLLFPSRDFWAYSAFFVMVTVFFLDSRYAALVSAEVFLSLLASWWIRPEVLLPVRDENFVPELILRLVFVAFSMTCICIFTHSIQSKLVPELERIADYDSLTMLRNRRSLQKAFDDTAAEADRTGRKFSVMMCDIDDFKVVNDTHGHACGDEVLKNVANVILHTVGSGGRVFRFGGEEIFAIVFGSPDQTARIAEQVRENVERSVLLFDNITVGVTVTVGVAAYGADRSNLDDLIRFADTNLYYGKNHGKNQVVV